MNYGDAESGALPRDLATLARLTGASEAAVLLKGATVLSMDEAVGDFEKGDVLLQGGSIAAVGSDLSEHATAAEALVVDCSGLILLPGFHDTHRHSWQNQFRRYIVDEDLDGYMVKMHSTMAHLYEPEDMYAGNLVTALGAIDSGVTTVLDFSHNSRSAAHSDAAVSAWADTGMRAVHASAAPFDGVWDGQWPKDLERIAGTLPATGLVSLRMALLPRVYEVIPEILALSPENLSLARDLNIAVSVDGFFGQLAAEQVELLAPRKGVLGPDITYIHCTDISDAAWRAIADSGGTVSLAPTSDAQVGISNGVPPVQECIDLGIEPSIGVDVECCLASDMFSQMRALLTIQRMNAFTRRQVDRESAPQLLTDREVLRMATIAGAHANGLGDISGSLTPGKDADIIAVRTDDVNMFPVNDAVAAVVQGADSRNIEFVMVAGRILKWERQVVSYDVDHARRLAVQSRDRLLAEAGVAPGIVRHG